jgi:hypothetical protein
LLETDVPTNSAPTTAEAGSAKFSLRSLTIVR